MPSTTSFDFADVVLVPFPFTDQTATKKRPAVVVSSLAYHAKQPDLIIMAITSRSRRSTRVGEATIRDWQQAGLLKPSVLKPLLATIDRKLVVRRLGKLATGDRRTLRRCLLAILGS
jgi:mRNA interferase MazF